jgi:hypothetical protein
MRIKLIGAVVVGLLVIAVVGGCGSSSKKAATTTTAATTSASTTSTTGLKLTSSDCANLAAASQTVSKAMSGKVPANIDQQIAALNNLVKVAPAAIKPDLEVLAGAAAQFIKIGIKPGQTPTAAQMKQLLKLSAQATKLQAATTHLEAWAKKNCLG